MSNHWIRKQRKHTDATSDLVDAISHVGDRLVNALSDLHSEHRETSELAQTRECIAHKEGFAILASHVDRATKNMDKLITLMETSTRRIADAMDRQTAALEKMARLFAARAPASPNRSVPLASAAAGLPKALNTLREPHAEEPKAPALPSPCESEECPPEAKRIKKEDD